MRVLVACEVSGRVRDAFIAKGHDAVSCDLLPSDRPGPHYQCDVLDVLDRSWDLVLGFPPCTDLSWANGRLIHEKRADGRTARAVEFAERIYDAGTRAAIENPSRGDLVYWRKPTQIIQPWQYGDPYIKTTALWLRDLPMLVPTYTVEPDGVRHWVDVGAAHMGRRRQPGVNRNPKTRSATFISIACAMAQQWG